MAQANAPLELTSDQRAISGGLALAMKGVAAILFLLAGVNVVGGGLTLVMGGPIGDGLIAAVEGLATGFLGLVILSCSTDVRFMVETKHTSVHLGNALHNLSFFYQVQFGVAAFLLLVACIRVFTG
jgi:hypothetical protein